MVVCCNFCLFFRLEVTNKAPIVLCVWLFDDKKSIVAQIKTYRRLMLRFCHENQKAQKYLMGGIEKTIETFKDTLLAKTGGILKAFFDHDILDEEVIIEWGKKVRIITFLFVFMTGLKTSLEI